MISPQLIRLSAQLAWRHIGLYLGCLLTVAATSFIVSFQVALGASFGDVTRVRVPYLDPRELSSQLTAIRGLLYTMGGLAIVISGFLMFSAIKQIVSLRQREMAMMRFAGVGRGQICWMIFLECVALSLLVATPTAFLANAVASPAFTVLRSVGLFGKNVAIDARFDPILMLAVALILSLSAAVGGLLAAQSVTRGELVSAISPARRKLDTKQILWRLLVVAFALVAIALLGPENSGPAAIMIVPLLGSVPLVAIAPLLIPPVTAAIGRVFAAAFPGSAMLAAQRAAADRWRFAGLATPMILAVGLLGGFYVANVPDEHMRAEAYRQRLKATSIVSLNSIADADQLVQITSNEQSPHARFAHTNRTVSGTLTTLYFTDAPEFATLLSQTIADGRIADVADVSVASSLKGAKVGDTHTVIGSDQREIRLRVVAVVVDPLFEGVFVDWSQVGRIVEPQRALPSTVFMTGSLDYQAVRDLLLANNIEGSTMDKEGYVEDRLERRRANTSRSNISLFGTIYVMSLISLTQTIVSANIGRRREFGVFRSLGIGRGRIAWIATIESVILVVVSAVLVSGTLTVLAARFTPRDGTSLATTIGGALPPTALAFAAMAGFLISLNAISSFVVATRDLDHQGRLAS